MITTSEPYSFGHGGDRSNRLLRHRTSAARRVWITHPGAKRQRGPALTRGDQPLMRRPLGPAVLDPYAASVARAILDGPPCRGAGTAPAPTPLPLGVEPKPGHRPAPCCAPLRSSRRSPASTSARTRTGRARTRSNSEPPRRLPMQPAATPTKPSSPRPAQPAPGRTWSARCALTAGPADRH